MIRQVLVVAALAVSAHAAFAADIQLPEAILRQQAERQEKAAAPVDAEALRQQRALLHEYRKPETGEQRRMDIVRLAASKGDPMRGELLAIVEPEYEAKRRAYLTAFERAASSVVSSTLREAGEKRVAELRKKVLDARDAGDKDRIVREADPALAELTRLLTTTPQQVLAKDPSLRPKRQELERVAVKWALLHGRSVDEVIESDERGVTDAAIAGRSGAGSVYAYNRPLLAKIDPAEAGAIRELNRRRILVGLEPLKVDLKLVEASRGHSRDMTERDFFAHESPVPGKKSPWDRAKLAGTRARGENIAYGPDQPAPVIDMWWHSPGHMQNMLGDFQTVGVGKYSNRWTQMFG